MNTRKLFGITFAAIFGMAMILAGCDSVGTNAAGNTGTLEVRMHDAPANYDQVNVSIKSVEVNNTKDDTGWVEISSPQKTYDLLKLTNGATTLLGSKELPVGTYEQIRLILNKDGNNVVVNGTQHDLKIPSGSQTGIKLNVNAEIKPDITYKLLLDFDASRSVVEAGNQHSGVRYLLKPVVDATNEATTGIISGVVNPADSKSFVYAIAGSDTMSSTKADTTDGSFKLIGLNEDSYTVSVDPSNEIYQSKDTTGVKVTVGETNNIGTIELPQQ